MPRLSRAQEAARRRVAELAGRGLSPAPLGRRLLAAVAAALPADGSCLLAVDPATLLFTRLLAADEPPARRLRWLREVYLARTPLPYVDFPGLMRAGLRAVAFQPRQEACWGYPPPLLGRVAPAEHRRVYHEHGTPAGGTLLVSCPAGGRWAAALILYRDDARRPFAPGDVAFLRLLAPALGGALAAALARERALTAGAAAPPGASGVLVLAPDGRLRYGTPAGEAWCARVAAAERGGHGPLPTALWAAAAALRAAPGGAAAAALVVPTAAGPVRVEASPGGADGSVALVLAPAQPPAAPDVPPAWPLTRREREVVALLVRGRSNRGIAAALGVSEKTVETHLGHAYEQLGVGGRGPLLARFFREAYWPAVHDPSAPDQPE